MCTWPRINSYAGSAAAWQFCLFLEVPSEMDWKADFNWQSMQKFLATTLNLTTKEPLIGTSRNKLLNLENHDLTLREASLTRTSLTIKHHRTTQTMPVGLRVHTLPPGLNLVCFLMSLMSFWGLLKSLWQPRIHACLSWLIDISYDRSDIMWFENWGPFRSTETNTKRY